MEKAHQIKVKADDEFTIAKVIIPCFCKKTHLILRRNLSIRGEVEVAQKMFAYVHTPYDVLNLLLREPSTPLYTQSGRHNQFLEGVIAESFLRIMESTVNIHCLIWTFGKESIRGLQEPQWI